MVCRSQASQGKGNEDLGVWIGAIRNHFWYCCRSWYGNVNDLKVCKNI